jgi:hypothetical protein
LRCKHRIAFYPDEVDMGRVDMRQQLTARHQFTARGACESPRRVLRDPRPTSLSMRSAVDDSSPTPYNLVTERHECIFFTGCLRYDAWTRTGETDKSTKIALCAADVTCNLVNAIASDRGSVFRSPSYVGTSKNHRYSLCTPSRPKRACMKNAECDRATAFLPSRLVQSKTPQSPSIFARSSAWLRRRVF